MNRLLRPGGLPGQYEPPAAAGRPLTVPATPGPAPDRPVIELEHGITVYPARWERGRWRAVWYEDGERQQCEAVTEDRLAVKLEKVTERLAADAPNMRRPGADLIAHYLNPDRLPVEERWSRKHADTQRRLCERFAAPVIGTVTCQDIKTRHTQTIVNAAPTAGEGDRVQRMISALVTVDRKVVEIGGYLYVEAPRNRKLRRTIYPRLTPGGYPLADRLAARVQAARAEQEAGINPPGLIFPSPTGKYCRSSNFSRRVLKSAYLAAGWRDSDGNGRWTWHSLRHVFCITALFTWKLDATDVSRMAGHANYRITLDMYVGTTADILDRARNATE
jgi:hypothetical protein